MSSGARCEVLIVEDDTIQCEEMAGLLGRTGIAVGMAFNGASALRQAAELRPRVALLDYNLPDMNGVELAERLRALLPEISILMMSGRIEGLSETAMRTAGVTVFVNKPVPLGLLRQAVVKLLRNGPIDPAAQKRTSWLSAGYGGTR